MHFSTPRNIMFGRGSVKNIERYLGKKCVIVTGKHTWENVKDLIPIDAPVLFVTRHKWKEPSQKDAEVLAENIREHSPDTIIAVGGGSVIDTAKVAWIIYENPEISWNVLYSYNIPELRKKARFIAIETTSGTGSGVSAAAIILDEEGKKRGVVSGELIPDLAIYDANFVEGMPRDVALYSGMDALSQAIEAYISTVDNIIGDTLALKAIELIYKNLPKALEKEDRAIENVHHGDMLAGMGFANSRLCLGHAAAHSLGGKYKIEHGKIVAIVLPYIIRANEKHTPKVKEVAKLLGMKDLARAIWKLNEELGIPHAVDIKDEDIEMLGEEIANDRLMKYNPRKMSKEDVIKMLRLLREGVLDEI